MKPFPKGWVQTGKPFLYKTRFQIQMCLDLQSMRPHHTPRDTSSNAAQPRTQERGKHGMKYSCPRSSPVRQTQTHSCHLSRRETCNKPFNLWANSSHQLCNHWAVYTTQIQLVLQDGNQSSKFRHNNNILLKPFFRYPYLLIPGFPTAILWSHNSFSRL